MENFPPVMFYRNPKRSSRQSSKYLGVRRRPWGRYAVEIRNPYTKERHWLGTFDTEEEAAIAYDLSSISFSGIEKARTNFYYPFLALPPSPSLQPIPQRPPQPPPLPPVELEGREPSRKDMNTVVRDDDDGDDESMVIASILQSFCQPSDCSFYP